MEKRDISEISVLEICEKACVSVGSFYHYFPSKDVVAFSKCSCDAYFANLIATHKFSGSPCDDIMFLLYHHAYYAVETGLTPQTQLLKHRLSPAAIESSDFSNHERPFASALCKCVDLGVKQGVLTTAMSASDIATSLGIFAVGFLYHWCTTGGDFPILQKSQKALACYLKSFCVDPEHTTIRTYA